MTRFYAPPETHFRPISPGFYAVVNHRAQRPVSVVSAEATRILRTLVRGGTAAGLRKKFPDHSKGEIEGLLADLVKAELLFEGCLPPIEDFLPAGMIAWLQITNRCNLRCRYCFITKTPEDMSQETAEGVVDALFRSVLIHGFSRLGIKFAGGEALLNPRAVFAAIDRTEARCRELADRLPADFQVHYELLSNGVAISDLRLRQLKERNIHLMISLDGLERDHDAQRIFPDGSGSFVRVIRTLERVKRSGIPFNISAVISNLNVEGIPAFVEFLLKEEIPFVLDFYKETPCSAGDPSLRVEPERIIRSMKDAYAAIERYLPPQSMLDSLLDMTRLGLLHDRPCGVGQNYIAFDPRGRAVKCQMAFDDIVFDSSRPDPLGDIRADLRGIQNPPATEKPGCRDCRWIRFCAGGCPLLAYRTSGSYSARSPYCRVFKALVPEVIRLEGLRLLKWAE